MNILDILWGTPVWVWVVFVYIIISGIKSMHSGTVPLWRLGVLPLVFITWSLYSVYSKCGLCSQQVIFWLIPALLGVLAGYATVYREKCSINAQTGELFVPGSVVPLVLSLVFFCIKYGLGVTYALNAAMRGDLRLLAVDLIASGLISGISLGRFIAFAKAYRALK